MTDRSDGIWPSQLTPPPPFSPPPSWPHNWPVEKRLEAAEAARVKAEVEVKRLGDIIRVIAGMAGGVDAQAACRAIIKKTAEAAKKGV